MAGRTANSRDGTREARVQHIEEMMRTFKYVRGKSARELAKQWGVSLDYVHQMTAQASKRIAAAIMDPETVNAKVGLALDQIISDGMKNGKHRDVIEAAKAWAHIAGSSAPAKHEVTGKDGAPVCGPVIYMPPELADERKGDS
jgi:hypothetical protein